MSYKGLQIWQLARELTIGIHKMTLNDLPKFELYETGSLTNEELYKHLHTDLDHLGGKLNRFIRSVESQHNSLINEDPSTYNQ